MIGIDVSEHNGVVNWDGIDCNFAIIRTGFGYADEDGEYARNIANCTVPFGLYHFSYATSEQGVINEANFVLDLVNNQSKKPSLPIFFDWEGDSYRYAKQKGVNVDKALFSKMAVAFMDTIKKAGYTAGIYYNYDYYKNFCNDSVKDKSKYYQWFAYYGDSINIDCDLWQNSENGVVSGFKGDTNILINEELLFKGENNMSRILQTGINQISYPYGNGHNGIDIVKQYNQLDDIVAHSDGTVIFCQTGIPNDTSSGGNRSYGNCVKIKHANGYSTLYAHLSSVSVVYGQKVTKGQKIGRMGNTGNSYGAHLHFEVRNPADSTINPTSYINADLPNLPTSGNEDIPSSGEYLVHIVVSGDTLTSISKKYDVTVEEIVELNNISNPNIISVGQELKIKPIENKYEIGTYKVTTDLLNVREGASTENSKLNFNELTQNAQSQILALTHTEYDGYVKGVVCSVVEIKNNNWGKTASGWICLDYCEKI